MQRSKVKTSDSDYPLQAHSFSIRTSRNKPDLYLPKLKGLEIKFSQN